MLSKYSLVSLIITDLTMRDFFYLGISQSKYLQRKAMDIRTENCNLKTGEKVVEEMQIKKSNFCKLF